MTCDRFSKSSSVVFFYMTFFRFFSQDIFGQKKKISKSTEFFFFPFLICLFYQVLYVFHTEKKIPPVWHIFFLGRKSTLAFFSKKRKKHGGFTFQNKQKDEIVESTKLTKLFQNVIWS